MPETDMIVQPPAKAELVDKLPKAKMTHAQKCRMALMVKRGVVLAVDPEVLIPRIAKEIGVDEDTVTECFDRFSAYTREQLEARSKLINRDRHFQRGLLIERLEELYGIAIASRDLKVAMAAIKESRELLDLTIKRQKKDKDKPKDTPAPKNLEAMTEEELREAAKGRQIG